MDYYGEADDPPRPPTLEEIRNAYNPTGMFLHHGVHAMIAPDSDYRGDIGQEIPDDAEVFPSVTLVFVIEGCGQEDCEGCHGELEEYLAVTLPENGAVALSQAVLLHVAEKMQAQMNMAREMGLIPLDGDPFDPEP